MDVFFSTGERSGDLMAASIASALRRRAGRSLDVAGATGPISATAGVRNVFEEAGMALVGVERHKLRFWSERLEALVRLLARRRPKVFVGVTHPTFNLPLAGLLPRGTHRILVGPPEVWGWRLNSLARCVELPVKLALWLRGNPYHWGHAGPVTLHRDRLALANFDELVCMLPMNHRAYRSLARSLHAATRIRMVGHRFATLRRTPALQAEAAGLRADLGAGAGAHVLGVFPGSRVGAAGLLLRTMLPAVVEVLRRRSDVLAVVSVSDPSLDRTVRGAIAGAAGPLDAPDRLTASGADASVLLTAASHALMSSGTITLQAACLAVPGTVAYVLPRHWLSLRFAHHKTVRGEPMPWALPNAILACRGAGPQDRPYPEFVHKQFRAPWIAQSILARLPAGPLRPGAPPTLEPAMVAAVRSDLAPAPEERPGGAGPGAAVAESILEHLRTCGTGP